MKLEKVSGPVKQDWEKTAFCQLTIDRINSLLKNPDLSSSQRKTLLNILKQKKQD